MARVKKPGTDQFDSNDLALNTAGTLDAYPVAEAVPVMPNASEEPVPVELPVPAPAPPVAPAPVKAAVAKVYQAGDEYSAGGKKGKVIVVLKDVLKVRWTDGSVGFVKK